MSCLHINGTKLFYECTGADSPPLVFVHGFACGHDDWGEKVEVLEPAELREEVKETAKAMVEVYQKK